MKGTAYSVQRTGYRVRSTKREHGEKLLFVIFFCFLFSFFCFLPTQWAYAGVVSSTELVENPKKYNGEIVTFEGEVIGDVMVRGDYAWINVNDDTYSRKSIEEGGKFAGYNSGQSIWLKRDKVGDIVRKGDYREKGDIIRAEGIFNRACPEHGGDMDIHAKKLTIVERGTPFKHLLDLTKVVVVGFLALLSGSLYLLYRATQRRRLQQSKT